MASYLWIRDGQDQDNLVSAFGYFEVDFYLSKACFFLLSLPISPLHRVPAVLIISPSGDQKSAQNGGAGWAEEIM